MSTETVEVCKCDYCGHVFESGEERIEIFANENCWMHFSIANGEKTIRDISHYELDFCNIEHMTNFIRDGLKVETE